MHGIHGNNLSWFKSYLSNRKQCVKATEEISTDIKLITCGLPQGLILWPLLFLLYIDDLSESSHVLGSWFLIMFADDTDLFINVNDELINEKHK